MIGLYQKAIDLLNKEIENKADFKFDEDSGITKEDQKDILEQINKITSESRISVTPKVFDIKSDKKGVLLPLLVNIIAAILLGSFVVFQYISFQKTTEILTTEQDLSAIDQGKLLEQVQREQEEELARKELEISGIQNELEGINAEREDLIANMDFRVQEKADELRRQMELELEAERNRLQNQGVSEEEIQRRLSELEQQKESESNTEIETFKDELENQKELYEQLEAELQAQLNTANQDKNNLEEEYQRMAQELEEAKSEAEEELLLLSEQKEQEEIFSAQLIEYYNNVEEDMNAERLNEALNGLATIRDFMNDKSVLALPEISKRRNVEFFVVGSLETLIKNEIQKQSADTSSLIASANLITSIREKVISADNAYNSGNLEEASDLYEEALGIIPEIEKSHSILVDRIEEINQSRLRSLERYLNNAADSYNGNDYETAIYYYKEALSYIPITDSRTNDLISQIKSIGFSNEIKRLTAEQTETTQDLVSEADSYYDEEDYAKAIPLYVSIIAKYPYSSQVNDCINGIASSMEGLKIQSIITVNEDNTRIDEMEALLKEKISEIDTLKLEKQKLEEELTPLKEEMERLKQELEELRNNPVVIYAEPEDDNTTEDNTTETENSTEDNTFVTDNNTEDSTSDADNTTVTENESQNDLEDVPSIEMERLLEIEKEYNELKAAYYEYITKEEAVLREKGEEGLVQSKIYLDIFLASRSIENIFEGLRDRIKMYDIAFEKVGREIAFLDIKDIIYDLSLFVSKRDKLSFLDSEISKNSDDDAFVELLEELRDFVDESTN